MIRTGILSDKNSGDEPAQLIALFKELKITAVSFDAENAFGKANSATEEIVHSSDILYVDLPGFSAEQLKLAIRNSTHLFCRRIPSLTMEETHDLINLENEAGCVVQIFHPHLFLPENLVLFRNLQRPLLVNIRLMGPRTGLEHQLRDMLLILALLDKSSIKKLDVNTLEGENDSYVLDIRLAYSSGSIARLILSTHFQEDQSVLEVFQINNPILQLPLTPLSTSRQMLSLQRAVGEFLKAVKMQPAVVISLNEFFQAQQIMQRINEKLRYLGSQLLE
ncbi:MAG: hypothetical protein AAGU19_16755 [Prolixibacteraceae bacterium]